MKYMNNDEIINKGFLMLDGDEENIEVAAQIISKYTKIPSGKVKTFIMMKGLKTLFDNPSLIGANEEQAKILFELKDMIDWGLDTYESV